MSLFEKTIGECLQERAELTPDNISVVWKNEEYTWCQLMSEVHIAVTWMLKKGIRRRDKVALVGKNSFEWIVAFYALMYIGAVAVPISYLYKKRELKVILSNTEIQYILCERDSEFQSKIGELVAKVLPNPEKIDWIGGWKLVGVLESELISEKLKVAPTDMACILFTSGSTNCPKGVMLSHKSIVNNSMGMCNRAGWSEQDRICLSVPLFHCFGISAGIVASVVSGAGIYICEKHKTDTVLQTVEKYKCTIFSGVPTMFLAMVHSGKYQNYDISSVKSGIIAGSRVSLEEYRTIRRALKMERLHISYGQTESSPCITMASGLEINSDSVGYPLEGVQIRIWDRAENKEKSQGMVGNIQTKGYHVMLGYYKDIESTREAIDPEGWLNTGDLGYLGENGELYVIGREKDMIIRGGENIAPTEIESCIRLLMEIADVKVFGIPSLVLQEEIAAVIVLKESEQLTELHVQNWVREHLAEYKVPKYVQFLKEMPTLPSGKIDMKRLEELVSRCIGDCETSKKSCLKMQ